MAACFTLTNPPYNSMEMVRLSSFTHPLILVMPPQLAKGPNTLHLASSLIQETMNSHCPINRLPPEFLALVFSMVPSALSHHYLQVIAYLCLIISHIEMAAGGADLL